MHASSFFKLCTFKVHSYTSLILFYLNTNTKYLTKFGSNNVSNRRIINNNEMKKLHLSDYIYIYVIVFYVSLFIIMLQLFALKIILQIYRYLLIYSYHATLHSFSYFLINDQRKIFDEVKISIFYYRCIPFIQNLGCQKLLKHINNYL